MSLVKVTKLIKKIQAQKMRREGVSFKKIARHLLVSPGSVSRWVRDIKLTEVQKKRLFNGQWNTEGRMRGTKNFMRKCREQRQGFQDEGRKRAREHNEMHLKACILYWAEGCKSRNQVDLANSEVEMLKFFVSFLREEFNLSSDKITMRVNCYLDNGLSKNEIENYWLRTLGLGKSSLRAMTVKKGKSGRYVKHFYGVCTVRVSSTRIIQHIYGAIQEYMGFEKEDWIK